MWPTRAPFGACAQVLPDHARRIFWEAQRQFFAFVGFMYRFHLLPRPGKNANTFASRGPKDSKDVVANRQGPSRHVRSTVASMGNFTSMKARPWNIWTFQANAFFFS